MSSCRRAVFFGLMAIGLASLPVPAWAQPYPKGPIRLILGYAPGGAVDIVSRLIADKLAEDLGQPVIVENRPGGGTVIASQAVAQAKPDGQTLMMADIAHGANPALQSTLPYDTVKDFRPVSLIVRFPAVLVTRQDLGTADLKSLIALAKVKPGALNYATSGIGSLNHLGTELLKSKAGLDIVHVPFKSGGEAMTAILGGSADMVLTTVPPVLSHLGKVRVLAVSSDKRLAALPDVPTFAEAGLPDFSAQLWIGLLAPGGTDPAVVGKLEDSLRKVLARPDIQARIEKLGGQPVGGSPAEFAAFIDAEIAKWKSVVTPDMRAN